MSTVITSFPDGTYTSSNKPSVETLKTDIQALETGHNELETRVVSASTSTAGTVELATTAETTTGTDTTRAVTPDGLHDMTSLAGAAWLKDEDDMVSDSATTVPSQQSVKAYVDTHAADTSTHGVSGAVVGTTDSQTLTNKAITFSDTTIGVNVKSRAARTSAQAVSDSTDTKITLDTETYDIGSDFDNATNYRFTAPVTGYYLVTAQVSYASAGDGAKEQLDIKKNGTAITTAVDRASGTSNGSVQVSDIVALSATDYLELWFTHSTGAGQNCTGFMAVHLISI